jgi:hypothetical protein
MEEAIQFIRSLNSRFRVVSRDQALLTISSVRFILRRQAAMPMLMRAPEDSWVSTI